MLFNQKNINIAEKVWMNISVENILPTDHKDLLKRSNRRENYLDGGISDNIPIQPVYG